jgi:quinol-cytochrome oxidoreductase complex cytochrome b subunit
MPRSVGSRLRQWLDERIYLTRIKSFFERQLHEPLPANVNYLHTLGFALLCLFLLQAFTGVLLMFYYRPAGGQAYESLRYILEQVRLGGLVYRLHALGASFIILLVVLHLCRVYFTGSYKRPRELTWMVGVFLLLVSLAFGFTGSLLPWDQLGFWATTVGTAFLEGVPLVGRPLLLLVRGGPEVSEITLSRFFTLHVVLLPAALLLLVGVHLVLVRLHNAAPLTPTTVPEKKGEALFAESGKRYVPHHLKKELTVAYAILGLLLLIALLDSPELGPQADPLHTPKGIKPEWYFLPLYQAMKYAPGWAGVLVGAGVAALLLLVPFVDRSPHRHPRQRRLAVILGLLFLLANLVLGALGALSETTRTILGRQIFFDDKGVPHAVGSAGDEEADQ